jgi:cysteine dioxygenase
MEKMESVENRSITSASLLRLIKAIESEENIDNRLLKEIIQQSGLDEADFHQFTRFNHDIAESYGRNKIYEGVRFSVFLMSWAPEDFTAIHSHGYCEWGAVVFFGDMNHRLYKTAENKVELVEKSIVPKGTIAPVTGRLVHAMGNLSDSPVMSLHMYGSNNLLINSNDDSIVYELEKKLVRTTNGSAYINMPDEFYKKTESGIETNVETISDYFKILLPFYRKNKMVSMEKYIGEIIKNPEKYFE